MPQPFHGPIEWSNACSACGQGCGEPAVWVIQIVVAPRPPRCVLRARGAFCTHIACDESAPRWFLSDSLCFLETSCSPSELQQDECAYCSCNLLPVRTVFLDPHILFPTIWTRLTVPVRSEKFGNDFAHACISDVCLAVFLRVRVDTSLVACKRAPPFSKFGKSGK